jgi:hypothetical protein
MEKIESKVKKLKRYISDSPAMLSLSAFLADPVIEPEKEQNTLNILRRLNQAASQRSIVVVQVQDQANPTEIITLSGWVATKSVSNDKVMLQLQDETFQMRIVSIDRILRVSALSPDGELSNASRTLVE